VTEPALATVQDAGAVAPAPMPALASHLLWFGVIVVALVLAHRTALGAMVTLWRVSPMYSYGVVVPCVSLFLVWSRRHRLRGLPMRPSWLLGSAALALSVLMTLAGRLAGLQVLEQLSFLVGLTAAALLLFGAAYVRTMWAALAYLLLMVPLWDGFTERLHVPFQLRSAEIGASLLRLVGIPAFCDQTFITLPNVVLEVARACSGVNYLVAVVAVGLPLSYVYLSSVRRRVILLVSAVVVAALSNGLRVALIGFLAYHEFGSALHGPFHTLHGLFVSVIGYVVLFAGLQLLATKNEASGPPAEPAGPPRVAPVSARPLVQTAVLLTTCVVVGSNVLAVAPDPTVLRQPLETVPATLGAWTAEGSAAEATSREQRWPGADAELARRYHRADGARVDVYVAYFALQHQRKDVVSYRATDLHNRSTRVHVGDGGEAFWANAADETSGARTIFWYDLHGRIETNRYAVKLRTLLNAAMGRPTGAAIVVVTAAPHANDDQLARDVAAQVRAALDEVLPR
jgi:EpsI family protein